MSKTDGDIRNEFYVCTKVFKFFLKKKNRNTSHTIGTKINAHLERNIILLVTENTPKILHNGIFTVITYQHTRMASCKMQLKPFWTKHRLAFSLNENQPTNTSKIAK